MAKYPQQYLNQIKQLGFDDPEEYKKAYNATNTLDRQARQKEYSAYQNMYQGNSDEAARNRLTASGDIPTNSPMLGMSKIQPLVTDNSGWLANKLGITIPNQSQDIMGMVGMKPKQSFPMSPTDNYQEQVPKVIPNAEVQSSNQEVTSNSPSEYESGILEQSKRQNDLLLQAANNAYANQERNAQNQVINYNNNQQAQMNRTANSMSSGSFTPTYQQAVYTPQSMNFGTQQQAPAMSFGSVPTEGLPRGGTINGVPVFGKQGERLNVSMNTLKQAGTDMQKKNQFVDANNQLQTKQVKGGFTANNINSTAMNNIGKYMPSITAPKKQLSQSDLVGLTANEDNSLPVSMTIPYTQPKNIKGPVSYNPAMDFASNQTYSRGF